MNSEYPEIILGLIGAAGTEFQKAIDEIQLHLNKTNYKSYIICLSDLVPEKKSSYKNEVDRINNKIKECNDFVKKKFMEENSLGYGAMAALTIKKIMEIRKNSDEEQNDKRIYIIKSLKRPDEIKLLRHVYGRNLVLLTIYQSQNDREIAILKKPHKEKIKEDEIKELFINDEHQDEKDGQKLAKTSWRSHFFIKMDVHFKQDIERFCRILFSDPFVTPTKEELGMYLAYAMSLRSSDLSRQVGAAVCDREGNIISSGCNDVPKCGGGSYWEGDSPDNRDFKSLEKINKNKKKKVKDFANYELTRIKENIIESLRRAKDDNKISDESSDWIKDNFESLISGSGLESIVEFYRAVHSESAAICDAALRGVSIKDAVLYCTTYPCHLCCKEIIASGIAAVVYIEPYPKSKALKFYGDIIGDLDEDEESSKTKVSFKQFRGVAPNRFNYVFRMDLKEERKTSEGDLNQWKLNENSFPKFLEKRTVVNYFLREHQVIKEYFNEEHNEEHKNELIDQISKWLDLDNKNA